MRIRQIKKEDYLAVDDLMQQLHQQHVQGRPDIFIHMEHPYTKEDFEKMLENPQVIFLAAEEDSAVIGLCVVTIREPKAGLFVKIAYMDDLVVDESRRGQGIARRLFLTAQQEVKARGAGRLDLMVWEFNQNALKLYESLGMKPQRYILEKPL